MKTKPIAVTASVAGLDLLLLCRFDYQPAEPEINVGESAKVTSAERAGEDWLSVMSPSEIALLEESLLIEHRENLADQAEMKAERRYFA